jgi:hypothetical protein
MNKRGRVFGLLSMLSVVFMTSFVSAQQGGTFLSNPFFVGVILPFLLIFAVVFAVLQKTKILGDGKRQVDAIVALVIGLIVVSFGYSTGIIVNLIPFMAVVLIVILIFMLLYGMIFREGQFKIEGGMRTAFGVLIAGAVLIAVLVVSGTWGSVLSYFYGIGGGSGSGLSSNVIFIVIIIVAVVAVMWGGGGKPASSS